MSDITILQEISDPKYLRSAWDKLNKSNPYSHGVSDENIDSFRNNLEEKIKSISQRLIDNKYRFKSYRPVTIPKKEKGKYRPLQIPEIEDRVVCKALAMKIEKLWDDELQVCAPVSFAYQKNVGTRQAIERIESHYKDGYTFVFESDIMDFFTNVDKDILLETVISHLPDDSISDLLKRSISAGISKEWLLKIREDQRHYFENVGRGIPQGNPLSPLFANIYLIPFDTFHISKGNRLVRYADDFVILCKSIDECRVAYEDSRKVFESEQIKLKIHELKDDNSGKTRILDIKKDSLTFLSVTFDGKTKYPSRQNVDKFKEGVDELCSTKSSNSRLVSDVLQRLSNKLDGWVSAFFYTDLKRYFNEIDYHINRQLYLYLSKKEWRFSPKSLGKVPMCLCKDKKPQSRYCISRKQRLSSGVAECKALVKLKRAAEEARLNNVTQPKANIKH